MKAVFNIKTLLILAGFFVYGCRSSHYITDAEYKKQIQKYEKQLREGRISCEDYIYLCFGFKELHLKK